MDWCDTYAKQGKQQQYEGKQILKNPKMSFICNEMFVFGNSSCIR